MNRTQSTRCALGTRPRRAAVIGATALGALVTAVAAAPTTVSFQILSGKVRPQEPFAVKFTVLGAAIQDGPTGEMMPVTMQIHLKPDTGPSRDIEPFGPFDRVGGPPHEAPFPGNLNPDVIGSTRTGRPIVHRLSGINPADMEISIRAKSWKLEDDEDLGSLDNADWEEVAYRKSDTSPHVYVLRDGDPVPPLDGFMDQAAVAYYVRRYVNRNTNTMQLGENEAIYLFELGSDDPDDEQYDLQDLVVLVTLATTELGLEDQFD